MPACGPSKAGDGSSLHSTGTWWDFFLSLLDLSENSDSAGSEHSGSSVDLELDLHSAPLGEKAVGVGSLPLSPEDSTCPPSTHSPSGFLIFVQAPTVITAKLGHKRQTESTRQGWAGATWEERGETDFVLAGIRSNYFTRATNTPWVSASLPPFCRQVNKALLGSK